MQEGPFLRRGGQGDDPALPGLIKLEQLLGRRKRSAGTAGQKMSAGLAQRRQEPIARVAPGQHPFADTNAHACPIYWDAWKAGLTNLVAENLIRGVYWVEELAVKSFLTTRVLPHVHAIVEGDDLSPATLDTLTSRVEQHLREHFPSEQLQWQPLQPNVKVQSVRDAKSLRDHVGYMNKPMNILKAYEQAWPVAAFHNRHWAPELNSELTDIVKGHTVITTGRDKMQYKGNLNPKDKRFIGIPKDERTQHRDLLNELRAQPATFVKTRPSLS